MNTKDMLDVLRKRLIDAGYTDYDLSDDSVMMDITAKVFEILAAPLEDQMDIIENGQTINNYGSMTSDQMDALIANVFLERRQGAKAKVTISIYLTAQTDLVVSAETDYFYTKSGLKFFPQSDYSFSKIQLITETILGSTYYRYDIPCIAESVGSAYEVEATEVVYTTISVPYFSHVANKYPATGGVDEEDNTALKTSAERAIATRDNVMKDSIWTVFMQKYGDLLDLYTVGYLDSEMQRDVTRASWCFYGHRGGMSDVYVKNKLEKVVTTCIAVDPLSDESGIEFTDLNEDVSCETIYYDKEIYDGADGLLMIRSRKDVRVDYAWIDYLTALPSEEGKYIESPVVYGLTIEFNGSNCPILAVRSKNKHHTYSVREAMDFYIQTPSGYNGEPLDVIYFRNTSIEIYQSDIVTPVMRPIVADTLFKNFIPIVITDMKITYVNTGSSAVVKKDVEEIIKDYLFDHTGTYPIYISEIISLVVNKTGIVLPEIGARDPSPEIIVDTISSSPFYVEYTQHNIDGAEITTKSTRVLSAVEDSLLSASSNTCRYYTAENFLTLEEE